MSAFFIKVIPLIMAFFLGVLVKRLKFLTAADAGIILRLVLTATLPALSLLSILKVQLNYDLIYLPFTAQAMVFITYGISYWVGKKLKLPQTTFGSFIVGCMIMNTGFSLPFFMAAFGTEGFARASLFDIGNSFLIFTFIYYNAIKYGDNGKADKVDWGKFLRLPPLWGLLIGFMIRIFGWEMPEVGMNFLNLVGQPTIPLIMIALGLIFEPRLKNFGKIAIGVSIRMGLGLLFGWLLTMILGLEGMTRTIIIASSATPVGFNTLIFANLENMDREFAAGMVSISILIALGYLPLIIWLFS
jgi:predicted permease